MMIPSDDVLESLYKLRTRESEQLKNRIGIVRHGDSPEDIGSQLSSVETLVKRSIDQKLRLRNFDARHGRLESGAVEEKGKCSKGDQYSFRHVTQNRAEKPEHTAATHSEPVLSRGRCVEKYPRRK